MPDDSISPSWEPLVDALLDSETQTHALPAIPSPSDPASTWRQRWFEELERFRDVAVPVSMDLLLYWDHVSKDGEPMGYCDHQPFYDCAWLVLGPHQNPPPRRQGSTRPESALMRLRWPRFEVPDAARDGLIARGYGSPNGSITWVLADVNPSEPCTDSALLARLEQMIRQGMRARRKTPSIPENVVPILYVVPAAILCGMLIVVLTMLKMVPH